MRSTNLIIARRVMETQVEGSKPPNPQMLGVDPS